VHLSEPALAELRAVNRGEGDLVFTTTGSTHVSGFSRMKKRLDRLSGVTDWRLHDLRAALATALCDEGEDEAVVDRILNHVAQGSAPSAVSRVYNRANLLPQRAAALDRWAGMVTGGDPASCTV
jgi:integrase